MRAVTFKYQRRDIVLMDMDMLRWVAIMYAGHMQGHEVCELPENK